ncbi:MAG: carbon storage regulator CsrA [Ruminococcus sp.]|nr:carbon storage regulator CsrA [Ruminococcus sp.]
MLILSRKKGESLVIGGNIELTVVEVSGDKVRLGINAPSDVSVLRAELKQTADQNKDSAAKGITPELLADMLNKK